MYFLIEPHQLLFLKNTLIPEKVDISKCASLESHPGFEKFISEDLKLDRPATINKDFFFNFEFKFISDTVTNIEFFFSRKSDEKIYRSEYKFKDFAKYLAEATNYVEFLTFPETGVYEYKVKVTEPDTCYWSMAGIVNVFPFAVKADYSRLFYKNTDLTLPYTIINASNQKIALSLDISHPRDYILTSDYPKQLELLPRQKKSIDVVFRTPDVCKKENEHIWLKANRLPDTKVQRLESREPKIFEAKTIIFAHKFSQC